MRGVGALGVALAAPIPPPPINGCRGASQAELEGVRLGLAGGPEGRAPAGVLMQQDSWSYTHQDWGWPSSLPAAVAAGPEVVPGGFLPLAIQSPWVGKSLVQTVRPKEKGSASVGPQAEGPYLPPRIL